MLRRRDRSLADQLKFTQRRNLIFWLKGVQESHQILVLSPRAMCWYAANIAECQGLCFQLEIDLGVYIGRVDRDVAKPGADGVYIDASVNQMTSGRVPDHMGSNLSFRQPGYLGCAPLHQPVDAKAREWLSEPT